MAVRRSNIVAVVDGGCFGDGRCVCDAIQETKTGKEKESGLPFCRLGQDAELKGASSNWRRGRGRKSEGVDVGRCWCKERLSTSWLCYEWRFGDVEQFRSKFNRCSQSPLPGYTDGYRATPVTQVLRSGP